MRTNQPRCATCPKTSGKSDAHVFAGLFARMMMPPGGFASPRTLRGCAEALPLHAATGGAQTSSLQAEAAGDADQREGGARE